MKKQSGFSLVEGLLIAFVVGVVGFAGYTVWNNQQDGGAESAETSQQKSEDTQETSAEEDSGDTIPDDWSTYEDDTLNYSFAYPTSWGAPTVSSTDVIYTLYFGDNINSSVLTIRSYTSGTIPGSDSPYTTTMQGHNEQSGVFYANWGDGKTDNLSEKTDFAELSNGALVWTGVCAFVDCDDTYFEGSFNINGDDFKGLGLFRVFSAAVDSKNEDAPTPVGEQDGDFELFTKVARTFKAN